MIASDKKSTDYNSFGVQKKIPWNFFCTYGVAFLYLFVLALFVFNYLMMARIKVLENENGFLKNDIEDLKQTLSSIRLFDDDLIRKIIEFEDEEDLEDYYSEQNPKTVLPDGSINEYPDYENYFEKNNENETGSNESTSTQQDETDSDRYEDSYTKLLNKLSKIDDIENSSKYSSEFSNKNSEETKRMKRNIVAATNDGVVINSESYAEKRAKNASTRYNLRGGSVTQYPARPSSIGAPWPVYPYSYSTAAYHRRTKPTKPTKPTKTPNVLIRSSRVKHFEDKSRAFKQKVKVANLKSLDSYQESSEDTTTFAPPYNIVRNTGFRRRSIKHLPSVHYSGDTSKYVFGVHDNFFGNDQLKHVNDMFVDWKAPEWMDTLKMHSHFSLEHGYVTVKQNGLYLIYAQIYYMDPHDRVGYKVFKNNKVILECAITSPSIGGAMKSNTCYTSGVEHFRAGDKLWLKDIEQRMSLFADGKSFFGMVKLGNISV